MAQHWQRRADILSRGVPETESRSFVLLVAAVLLPTSCTSGLSQGGWDVVTLVTLVTNRAATLQTLCISQGSVGVIEESFSANPRETPTTLCFCLGVFCFFFFVLPAPWPCSRHKIGVTFAQSGPPGGSEVAIGKMQQPGTFAALLQPLMSECVIVAGQRGQAWQRGQAG